MKEKIFITAAMALMTLTAASQEVVTGVRVNDFRTERNGNYLSVDMTLDLSTLKVTRNRAVLLTPCLLNRDDSLHLASVGVYGRRRYYQTLRRNGEYMLSGENELSFRKKELPAGIAYHELIPYEKWMNGADVSLHRFLYGCCEQILAAETGRLGGYTAFAPEFLYITPRAEVKTRSVEGTAYVDFVVNKTDIRPDYHNNEVELGKIRESIRAIQGDEDITIDNLWLKGYASPESSYAHNRELAMGRVNALKRYVQELCNFSEEMITTEYEPENWEGLRKYVEHSNLEHRAEILDLTDSDLEPDAKEAKIKSTYPGEYRILLTECYPYLRRTDYRVNYTVRGYSDIEEIRRILQTQPQKLSLNEMYLLAQTLEPGSEEFIEVFETAVRMYPEDEVANLNAANVEMKHGEYAAAERYLAKAGESGEAEYARGICCYLTEDYDGAGAHLSKASERGISQAATLLEKIK